MVYRLLPHENAKSPDVVLIIMDYREIQPQVLDIICARNIVQIKSPRTYMFMQYSLSHSKVHRSSLHPSRSGRAPFWDAMDDRQIIRNMCLSIKSGFEAHPKTL